ncbi:peptide ABC transporter substrate-binding protein [Erythrobacteraceae bacterium CFH 75059]|uniref:ABC transporter substrate-binding protein n=1 Tax=Qipengyuania thermophila TaxID=2509361 RepID=UPI001021DE5E|nr:ABC transporter substrate-binding protein [Qipengyuania thermophila]TCD06871.1 peptide ABC transporter substrate-binding protein [Erythrobacteraceae bacterium CFH 75059]
MVSHCARRLIGWAVLLALSGSLAACTGREDERTVRVLFVGQPGDLDAEGLRLPLAAQHLRAATHQGLVRMDENGEVVPGLAQSWIVTDDGLSYIFRLRDVNWPDGQPVTAQQVRSQLQRAIRQLQGTTLGLDLAKIADVRALTGRVVEIELATPMAQFLRVLAQPELGFEGGGGGLGPMRRAAGPATAGAVTLLPIAPEERGLAADSRWAETVRSVRIAALPAEQAVAAFNSGAASAVLGGDINSLPLLQTGPLARGTVRLNAVVGLFGLDVASRGGFLADAGNREAVALAIDRNALLVPFNVSGWFPATRIVPPDLPGDPLQNPERWRDLDQNARLAIARARAAAWAAATGVPPQLTISLPPGVGNDLLLRQLRRDLDAAGIELRRAGDGEAADLVLRDRVARYAQARWFMNQFACSVSRAQCVPEADALMVQANTEADPVRRAALINQAEELLTRQNLFIPLGAPVRWSLVRANTVGYADNAWGVHPLFPFSRAPL